MLKCLLIIITLISRLNIIHCQNRHSCNNPIYCQGQLLHTVQTAKIFNDSKTFVDMCILKPVNETLDNFVLFMKSTQHRPSPNDLAEFISDHFHAVGELEECTPMDFKPEPKIIREIEDHVVREFTRNLIAIWPTLCRVISRKVFEYPNRFSIIPVDKPFIIPGGRFKELYYWDSYWIVKGLLLSEMDITARGMVENLISMVEKFGFVPNGGRVYYLNRSQPPVLTLMVSDYFRYSKDLVWLRRHIHTCAKEMKFWLNKRTTEIEKEGVTYILARYDAESDTPRPESYAEDMHTCSYYTTKEEQCECYTELKGGAESGWDFTSRWIFDKSGGINANLSHIQTRRNIPVDLNAILYKVFNELHKLFLTLHETKSAIHWRDKAIRWRHSIEKVLYCPEDGVWYDYDNKLGKHRKNFYPSNLIPLWAEAFDLNLSREMGENAIAYLKKNGIYTYRGGIPTSLHNSGEQWDYPNAWSPLQALVIFGLEKSESENAKEMAKEFASTWVMSGIKAYHENEVMFEKYNAANIGQYGGGGEYHIQSGFGWSNGVMLELINYYYRKRTRKNRDSFA